MFAVSMFTLASQQTNRILNLSFPNTGLELAWRWAQRRRCTPSPQFCLLTEPTVTRQHLWSIPFCTSYQSAWSFLLLLQTEWIWKGTQKAFITADTEFYTLLFPICTIKEESPSKHAPSIPLHTRGSESRHGPSMLIRLIAVVIHIKRVSSGPSMTSLFKPPGYQSAIPYMAAL